MKHTGSKLVVANEYEIHVTDKGVVTMRCPKCGKRLPLQKFGTRRMADGTLRNQPYCTSCR